MKIAILGFGSVGRGVARVIREKDLAITVTGLADSRSGLLDPDGIDLGAALERKKKTGICGDRSVAPLDVVDYVVLHELVHTRVRNHSKVFWDKLAKLMPDYKPRLAWLKKNGKFLTGFAP